MASSESFGVLSAYALDMILREMVRRGMMVIRSHRRDFTSSTKMVDGKTDIVTSADHEAQYAYLKAILHGLPGFGVVAEEVLSPEMQSLLGIELQTNRPFLIIECPGGDRQLYVVVDSMDGSRAFSRRQNWGVASQLAVIELLHNRPPRVVAAYVGDVNSLEIYGYGTSSSQVHRITDLDVFEDLTSVDRSAPFSSQRACLRVTPEHYSPLVQRLVSPPERGGLVRGVRVPSGSTTLGTTMLWTGHECFMVMPPKLDPLWDIAPLAGINDALGFESLAVVGDHVVPYRHPMTLEPDRRDHDVIWVHRSRSQELLAWVDNYCP